MHSQMEVCPECREKQQRGKPIKLIACLIAAIFAWILFH